MRTSKKSLGLGRTLIAPAVLPAFRAATASGLIMNRVSSTKSSSIG